MALSFTPGIGEVEGDTNEDGRRSLTEAFGQSPMQGVEQLAQMFVPQSFQQGGFDLDTVLRDFVEFSPIGDVKDIAAGVRGTEGGYKLDWLERSLGVLSGAAIGASSIALMGKAVQHQASRMREAQIRSANLAFDQLLQPPPGRPYRLPETDIEVDTKSTGPGLINRDLQGLGDSPEALRLEEARYEAQLLQTRGRLMGFPAQDLIGSETFTDAGVRLALLSGSQLPNARPAYGKGPSRAEVGEASVRTIGQLVLEQVGPDMFTASEQQASLAGGFDEATQLAAGTMALGSLMTAVSRGALEGTADGPLLPGDASVEVIAKVLTDPEADPRVRGGLLVAAADLFGALAKDNIGPDLSGSPIMHIPKVFYNSRTSRYEYVTAIGGRLLPTRRLFDYDSRTRLGGDDGRVMATERELALDPSALTGMYAYNVKMAMQFAERFLTPEDFKRAQNWYPRANRSAQRFGELTGLDPQLLSYTTAVLSAQTRWLPNNLLGALHLLLQSKTDWTPDMAEYRSAIKEVLVAGEWQHDLWEATSVERRHQIFPDHPLAEVASAPPDYGPVLDYWAEFGSMLVRDENSSAVGTMDLGTSRSQNILNAEMGFAGVPWDLLVRTSKYGTFAAAQIDPLSALAVVIDTHSADIARGTLSKTVRRGPKRDSYGNPILDQDGNPVEGLVNIQPQNEGGGSILQTLRKGGSWTHPLSGMKIDLARFQQAVQSLVDNYGKTVPEAEKLLDKVLKQVPGEGAGKRTLERYMAMAMGHVAVAQELGVPPNQVQAPTWVPVSRMRGPRANLPAKVAAAETRAQLDETLIAFTPNAMLYSHIEGNPLGHATILTLTADATSAIPDLPKDFAKGLVSDPKSKGQDGQAILTYRSDKGLHVLADTTVPGVEEALRHLRPSGLQVQGTLGSKSTAYQVMVPRESHTVLDVDQHLSEVEAEGLGESRRWIGDVTHPVASATNTFMFEVGRGSASQVEQLLRSGRLPAMKVSKSDVQVTRRAPGPADLTERVLGSDASPLKQFEWAAISAEGGPLGHEQLRSALTELGLEPYEMEGVYRGATERSFLVFGADYGDIMALAERFGQESVMTRHGLLFRDGTMMPARDLTTTPGATDVPTRRSATVVNRELHSIVENYIRENGLDDAPLIVETVEDPVRSSRIADLFDEAPEFDGSPEVLAAYEAFKSETMQQFRVLQEAGYRMEPVVDGKDPYGPNSAAMVRDVAENKRVRFFITMSEGNFGSKEQLQAAIDSGHPLLEPVPGLVTDGYQWVYNDVFRAVHDTFGHAVNGHQFGPIGEENAWRAHARMFTPTARRAMTSETRGQNSWVNYGAHLRRNDGTLPSKGDPDWIPPRDRPYSQQKVFALPEEFTTPDRGDVSDSYSVLWTPQGAVTFRVELEDAVVVADLPAPAPVSEPRVMYRLDFGTPETSMPWTESDTIWSSMRNVPGVRSSSAYVNGGLFRPDGLEPVTEIVWSDLAGRQASYRYRGEPTGAPNETTVWVPRDVAASLPERAPSGAHYRRTMKEARGYMRQNGNRVTIDGDVTFEFPPGEVEWYKTGSSLSVKLDGKRVSEFSIDYSGIVPVIRPGGQQGPAAVRITVDSRGVVTKLRASSWDDAFKAYETLNAAGAAGSFDMSAAEVGPPRIEGAEPVADSVKYKWNPAGKTMTSLPAKRKPTAADVQLAEEIGAAFQTVQPDARPFPIDLPEASDAQRAVIKGVITSLVGAGDGRYSEFHALVEPINPAILTRQLGREGLTSADLRKAGPDTLGITYGWGPQAPGGVALDGQALLDDQVIVSGGFAPMEGWAITDDLSKVIVHETGHVLVHYLERFTPARQLYHRMESMLRADDAALVALRRRSRYSMATRGEMFAEMFTWVVTDPSTAPDTIVDIVRSVVSDANVAAVSELERRFSR